MKKYSSFFTLELLKTAINGKVGCWSGIDVDIYVVPKNYPKNQLPENAKHVDIFCDEYGNVSEEKWNTILNKEK